MARGVTVFELGTTVTAFTLPVATTTNVPVVVTVVVPSFAWTVKGYVPAGVVPLVVVMVSVEVLLVKVTGLGVNVAVVPAGNPEVTERVAESGPLIAAVARVGRRSANVNRL